MVDQILFLLGPKTSMRSPRTTQSWLAPIGPPSIRALPSTMKRMTSVSPVASAAARAEDSPLRLSRNLFGLLHKTRGADDPCPTLVPSHSQTWRNPSCLVS